VAPHGLDAPSIVQVLEHHRALENILIDLHNSFVLANSKPWLPKRFGLATTPNLVNLVLTSIPSQWAAEISDTIDMVCSQGKLKHLTLGFELDYHDIEELTPYKYNWSFLGPECTLASFKLYNVEFFSKSESDIALDLLCKCPALTSLALLYLVRRDGATVADRERNASCLYRDVMTKLRSSLLPQQLTELFLGAELPAFNLLRSPPSELGEVTFSKVKQLWVSIPPHTVCADDKRWLSSLAFLKCFPAVTELSFDIRPFEEDDLSLTIYENGISPSSFHPSTLAWSNEGEEAVPQIVLKIIVETFPRLTALSIAAMCADTSRLVCIFYIISPRPASSPFFAIHTNL
jgi:hypothetical protein